MDCITATPAPDSEQRRRLSVESECGKTTNVQQYMGHDVQEDDFECILDWCDLRFDSVDEVILPHEYNRKFCGPKYEALSFEERKDLEFMRNIFRCDSRFT